MDRENGIIILEGLIDSLIVCNVSAKKRRELYTQWFSIFEELGFDAFDEVIGDGEDSRDKQFDIAYKLEFE